jgi:hypothetical protein
MERAAPLEAYQHAGYAGDASIPSLMQAGRRAGGVIGLLHAGTTLTGQ